MADANQDNSETTDDQHQVTEEQLKNILDEKIPVNALRGSLKNDRETCSPLAGDKCY